jgi:hypothetical protein
MDLRQTRMNALLRDRSELTERQFLAKQRKNFKYGSKEYNELTKMIKKIDAQARMHKKGGAVMKKRGGTFKGVF